MSKHDEFQDLEERLRENRPSTEPLPPDVKRRLRADLMEKATMNDERGFTFGRLTAAAGAVLVLIGIPLLFWLIQGGRPLQPDAGTPISPTRETGATAIATPIADEEAVAETEPDRVWVIHSDPAPGTAVAPGQPIRITLGYELNSVDKARVTAKLAEATGPESGRGVGTAAAIVGRGGESTTLVLAVEDDLSAATDEVGLSLTLQPEGGEGERPLAIAFPEEYTWPLTEEETPRATAEIVAVGQPQPHSESNSPPDVLQYRLPITVAYTLQGAAKAWLIVAYDYQDTAGDNSFAINRGQGEIRSELLIDGEMVGEDGELADAVDLSVRINVYDEAAGAVGGYVNLYPGGLELSPEEENATRLSPGMTPSVFIRSVYLDPAAEEPAIMVILSAQLNTAKRAYLTVSLADATSSHSEPLDQDSVAIRESGLASVPLDLDLTTLPDETPLILTASLARGNTQMVNDVSLTAGDLRGQPANSVGFVFLDVMEAASDSPLTTLGFQARVRYHLSDAYRSGSLSFFARRQDADGDDDSGVGGGHFVESGVGLVWLSIGVTSDDLTLDNWGDKLIIEATLRGVTAAGEQVVVDTAVYTPE